MRAPYARDSQQRLKQLSPSASLPSFQQTDMEAKAYKSDAKNREKKLVEQREKLEDGIKMFSKNLVSFIHLGRRSFTFRTITRED